MTFRNVALLFGVAILHAFSLSAQTEQGPTLMSQLNSDFYVGAQSGAHSYPTIQAAVAKTCALSTLGSRVIIPAGSPADGVSGFTVSAVTSGCAKVAIIDQRAQPATTCSWGGGSYSCSSGGGSASIAHTSNIVKGDGVGNGLAATPGVDYVVPSGTVAKATALAAAGTPCSSGQLAGGVDASGNAINCATPTGSGLTPSPQFQMAFYPNSGSAPVIKGDNGTTDGSGNWLANTIAEHPVNNFVTPSFSNNNTLPHTPDASGVDGFGTHDFVFNNSGYGKNIGNADTALLGGNGWREGFGPTITMNCNASGICQGMHMNVFGRAAGDKVLGVYSGDGQGTVSGGYKGASDEGINGFNVNGTQVQHQCLSGTITATTGNNDIAPVVSCSTGNLVNDGYLIDTKTSLLTTTITGLSGGWSLDSTPLGLGSLPVAGGVTPSTGICKLITAPILASTVLGVPQSHSFTCTTISSLPITPGHVWIASSYGPEQATIQSVSGTGTITGTILSAGPHSVGSVLFQGGTQGLIVFDDEVSMLNQATDFIAFGATDSTDIIIGFPTAQGLGDSTGIPFPGSMASIVGSGIHVYPGALVKSLAQDSVTEVLEQNTVHWQVGDTVSAPNPSSYHETIFDATSTQVTFSNPSVGSQAYLAITKGEGASWSYSPFLYENSTPRPLYAPVGRLTPPSAFRATGPISNALVFDDPMPGSGNVWCSGGTILCNTNSNSDTKNIWLYQNKFNFDEGILINRSLGRFETGYGIRANSVTGESFVTTRTLNVDTINVDTTSPITINGFSGAFTGVLFQGGNNTTFQNQLHNITTSNIWDVGEIGAGGFAQCSPGDYFWMIEGQTHPIVCLNSTSGLSLTVPILADNISFSAHTPVVVNDLLSASSTTGQISDSGILKSSVALINAANTWATAQNFFTGSQVNGHLICTVDGTNCPSLAAYAQLGTANTFTAPQTVPDLVVTGTGVPIASGVSTNTDLIGELSFSSATTATYTFTSSPAPAIHLECLAEPQFDPGSGVRSWITYTGVTSMTINFSSAVTGNVSYGCIGRN
jgi:hypothetical protein